MTAIPGTLYLGELSATGATKYIVDNNYSTPTFPVLSVSVGSTYTPVWVDTNPPTTRRYQIFLDNVQQGDSLGSTSRSAPELIDLAHGDHVLELGYKNNVEDVYTKIAMTLPVYIGGNNLTLVSPSMLGEYVAESASVYFEWRDVTKPDAVYDLVVYSDAARTAKVTGTPGELNTSGIFDTNALATRTSYTFDGDPSNGGLRYGILWQWPNSSYIPEERVETLFEYTSYTQTVTANPDLDNLVAYADTIFADRETWPHMANAVGSDRYYYLSEGMIGLCDMHAATGDIKYLQFAVDKQIRYLDGGSDSNSDGYLDWKTDRTTGSSFYQRNKFHHELSSAMAIAALVCEIERSGATVTPANAKSRMITYLRHDFWTKWITLSDDGGDNLLNPLGWWIGRAAIVAACLDAQDPAPGTNRYADYINTGKFSQMVDDFITNYDVTTDSHVGNWWLSGFGKESPGYVGDAQHWENGFYGLHFVKRKGYTLGGRLSSQFMDRCANVFKNYAFNPATGECVNYLDPDPARRTTGGTTYNLGSGTYLGRHSQHAIFANQVAGTLDGWVASFLNQNNNLNGSRPAFKDDLMGYAGALAYSATHPAI